MVMDAGLFVQGYHNSLRLVCGLNHAITMHIIEMHVSILTATDTKESFCYQDCAYYR